MQNMRTYLISVYMKELNSYRECIVTNFSRFTECEIFIENSISIGTLCSYFITFNENEKAQGVLVVE